MCIRDRFNIAHSFDTGIVRTFIKIHVLRAEREFVHPLTGTAENEVHHLSLIHIYYIYKKNTGNASAPIDLEEAYLLASHADMWLHVAMANTLDELKAACTKFIDNRCFRGGQVYHNNSRTNAAGGNDYYESAVVNPDLVLRDLVKIFHPELVEEDFCLLYTSLRK